MVGIARLERSESWRQSFDSCAFIDRPQFHRGESRCDGSVACRSPDSARRLRGFTGRRDTLSPCILAIKVGRGWYVRSSVAETICTTLISEMLACLARLLTSPLGEHHSPAHRVGDRLMSSSHTHALK